MIAAEHSGTVYEPSHKQGCACPCAHLMATILIGTEVPEGMGHVAPWLDFCRLALLEKHSVHMAGPDLLVLQRCIASQVVVKVWAAPRVSPMRTFAPTRSWPELLVSLGYAQPEWLAGAVLSWANILDAVQPDVVLTDYAPALMVTCCALGVRYVEVGGGFCVPPMDRDGLMPPFPGLDAIDVQASREALAQLTHALRCASAAISNAPSEWVMLHQQAHRRIVLSSQDLDHYDERVQPLCPVDHVGFLGLTGLSPNSAASSKQRCGETGAHIVAYLKPDTPRLDAVVDAMASTGLPTQIYIPGLDKPRAHTTVRWAKHPLDLGKILGSKSLYVCNGGLASTGVALHRDATLLVVPQQVEQIAMARRLVKSGKGGLFWSSDLSAMAKALSHRTLNPSKTPPPPHTEALILEAIGLGSRRHTA